MPESAQRSDARAYFRATLALPLVVPVLVIGAAAALRAITGSTESSLLARFAVFLAFTLGLGGAPYAVFLLAALVWSRGKSAERIWRFTFRAPLYFTLTFLLLWVPYLSWQAGIFEALEAAPFLAAYCIGVGYAYVALVHVLDFLRRRA